MISKKSQTRKGRKPPRIKPESRSKLEKALWDVFSLYIRTRDGFTCFTCGRTKAEYPKMVFQAGHLFSRTKAAIKYDERNVHCQCYSCNTRHNTDPDIYREKFIAIYGREEYNRLYEIRNATCKRSRADIVAMTEYYHNKLKRRGHEIH